MSFAERYKTHAFHDLIQEAEKQGIANGAERERERIIKLLESDEWHHIAFATRSPDEQPTKYHDGECLGCRQIVLIKGEQK